MFHPIREYRKAVERNYILTATLQHLCDELTALRASTDSQTRAIASLASDLFAVRTYAAKLTDLEITRERRGPYGHLTNREEANGN
jgi:hypothetical protein